MNSKTKAYLMVLAVTLAGAAACWFLLGQIEKLQDDSEAVAALPFKQKHTEELKSNIFKLKIGQTAAISQEFSVKLISINDSRCPTDQNIQCIWAGKIGSSLSLFQSGVLVKTTQVDLNQSFNFVRYNILFFEVSPKEKKTGSNIKEYLLTFKIKP